MRNEQTPSLLPAFGPVGWGIVHWRIILPMSKPALTTLAIFTFMGSWKNFLWPLVVTHSQEFEVLPVMLTSFQG